MISEFILWQGHFQSLYEDEINDWLEDILEVERLTEGEITRLNLTNIADCDDGQIQSIFDGDSLLFEPRKILVIDHLEAWNAARINVLMKGLEASEVECFIAGSQRSGAVLKSVKDKLSEPPRDRRIPDGVQPMVKWTMDWLEDKEILIEKEAAYNLVEHAGEDSEVLVSTLISLSTITDKNKLITWDDVKLYAGDIGAVAFFKIAGYIVDGDSDNALRTWSRVSGSIHPLVLLKTLSNKYRQYLLIVGGAKITDNEIVELTGGNPKALFYTRKEASKIGLKWAIKGMSNIDEAYHDVKGSGPLRDDESMQVLITRLAHGFRMASASK